jgi:hypothetical protein
MWKHNNGPIQRSSGAVKKSHAGELGRAWGFLLGVSALLLAGGCEDEVPPPPAPSFVDGSAQLVCEADAEDLNVLVGGSVQVTATDLLSVDVELPGTPGALALVLEGTAEADKPQTWRFTFDPNKRLLCNAQLIATFNALDGRGERASVSTSAQ